MSIETTLPESTLRKITVQFGKDVIDLDKILPLARQLHKESMFSDMPFDQPQLEKVVSDLKGETGFHGSVYIEYEGEPVGFAYFYFSPLMGSRQTWVTVMHTVYIRSDIRSTDIGSYVWQRIMLAVRGWSAPRGSKGIMFNVVSGVAIEETDLVLRANGATHLGGNYFMRL
ncbi:GNAT family N-acetyltransferase [Paracoccus nototheniae]|uniref:GNAT family N-acetyltransferase n=1 Tax=Paracoccus nototheniae TaxID=2489002 RepID=A0ABW4DUT3_9RHOB|nr:GNAT family N-acetyltransferase [Paracoccus nototheniae]